MSNISAEMPEENEPNYYKSLNFINPDAALGGIRVNQPTSEEDAAELVRLQTNQDYNARMLGGMCKDIELLAKLRKLVKPSHFRERTQVQLCKLIYGHYDTYDTCPDYLTLTDRIAQVKEAGGITQTLLTTELEVALDAFEPAACSRQAILDRCAEMIGQQEANIGALQIQAAIKKGKPYQEQLTKLIERQAEIKELISPAKRDCFTFDELLELPPAEWLIDEVFPAIGHGMVFGASGSGKSFVALDIALCIATGKKYLNRYEVKQGPVFYLASEGGSGNRARATAWMEHNERRPAASHFKMKLHKYNLTEKGPTLEFIREIKKQVGRPAAVFIDTLNKNFGGLDENATGEMSKYVGNIDTIADELRCLVVSVHHTGKDKTKGARGSTSLHAACDTIYEVTGKPDYGVKMKCVKQKDGPEDLRVNFKKVSYAVKGEKRGSLVLQAYTPAKEECADLSPTERNVGQMLAELFNKDVFTHGKALEAMLTKGFSAWVFNSALPALRHHEYLLKDKRDYKLNPSKFEDLLMVKLGEQDHAEEV